MERNPGDIYITLFVQGVFHSRFKCSHYGPRSRSLL